MEDDATTPTPPTGADEPGRRRGRVGRFRRWRRDLTAELGQLPATLASLRTSAANFELVSQRLTKTSAALEDMTRVYEATMADSARLSAKTAELMRSQVEAVAGATPDVVAATLTEMQKTFESLAELNPLWPSRKPRNPE